MLLFEAMLLNFSVSFKVVRMLAITSYKGIFFAKHIATHVKIEFLASNSVREHAAMLHWARADKIGL